MNPRFSVIFPPMLWIFMESEEPEIKSKQASNFWIKASTDHCLSAGHFSPISLADKKSPHLLWLTKITHKHVSVIPHGYPWPLGRPDLPSSKSKIGWLQIPGNEHWGHGSIWQSMSLCRLFWMIVMQNFVNQTKMWQLIVLHSITVLCTTINFAVF